MHAFDVLSDPVRRRILELLADGEQSAGAVVATISAEFGISQPAVSQHLKVLREVDDWLAPFRQFWSSHLDALGTEIARGRRAARVDGHTIPEERT